MTARFGFGGRDTSDRLEWVDCSTTVAHREWRTRRPAKFRHGSPTLPTESRRAAFRQALGVPDRRILRALFTVGERGGRRGPVDDRAARGPARRGRNRHAPCARRATDDASREGVDDEGGVNEARPGRDVCKIRNPPRFQPRRPKPAVHPAEGQGMEPIADRCFFAANRAVQTYVSHT
jgi:hypothetical protein